MYKYNSSNMLIKTYDYNLSFIICNKHTWLELKLGLKKISDYYGCGIWQWLII